MICACYGSYSFILGNFRNKSKAARAISLCTHTVIDPYRVHGKEWHRRTHGGIGPMSAAGAYGAGAGAIPITLRLDYPIPHSTQANVDPVRPISGALCIGQTRVSTLPRQLSRFSLSRNSWLLMGGSQWSYATIAPRMRPYRPCIAMPAVAQSSERRPRRFADGRGSSSGASTGRPE